MSDRIEASRRIKASPADIYNLIADYRDGHRRIVPPRAFLWLAVEEGGVGAGTKIRFAMRVLGMTREALGVVTEPEPGRLLVETYPETGDVTSFRVTPAAADGESDVVIATDLKTRGGIGGKIQASMAGRLLRPLYDEELQRIADIAEGRLMHDPVPAGPES